MAVDSVKAGAQDAVNINYTINSENRNTGAGTASRSILAMTRPAMIGVGLLAAGTLAAGVFGMFRVPGLQEQIKELEAEVDRLTHEIDTLQHENDRYEVLNADLNDTLYDLIAINEDLSETAKNLQNQTDRLNTTVMDLTEVVDNLNSEKEELKKTSQALNETQQEINQLTFVYSALNVSLTQLNQDLKHSSAFLSEELEELENINAVLMNTTEELAKEVENLAEINVDLAKVVDDLETINQYFTVWSVTSGTELDALGAQLKKNTLVFRETALRNLEGLYIRLEDTWQCMNQIVFVDKPFFTGDRNRPIYDPNQLIESLDWLRTINDQLNKRMLEPMCLGLSDYDAFMKNRTGRDSTTFTYNDYSQYSKLYGNVAWEWYFYNNVSKVEWETASFDCKLLDESLIYKWNTA